MARWNVVLLGIVLLGAAADLGDSAGDRLDRYGGWPEDRHAATGWFRTLRAEGRWWLVDPDGHLFISVGANTTGVLPTLGGGTNGGRYEGAAALRYGREEASTAASVARLKRWGFNTLGAWCDRSAWRHGMPYTVPLSFADLVPRDAGCTFQDVFDPAYEAAARRYARRECRRLVDSPMLMGYFTDSELRWLPDGESAEALFVEYLGREDGAPGRRKLLEILERWYLNIDELNHAWGTTYDSFERVGRIPQVGSHIPPEDVDGFVRVAAEQYFRVAHDAIRAVDDHHLILGCRFAGSPPRPVLEAMLEYVDVVSLNHYGKLPPVEALREVHRATGKPMIIASFSLPGGGETAPRAIIETEREHAEWYESYVAELVAMPMVVGWHWSGHADSAAEEVVAGQEATHGPADAQEALRGAFVETVGRANRSVYGLALGER
jgi:agarase